MAFRHCMSQLKHAYSLGSICRRCVEILLTHRRFLWKKAHGTLRKGVCYIRRLARATIHPSFPATMTKLPTFDQLPIDAKYPAHSAWGLWGEDDNLGTLNLLTPERVAEV